MMWPQRVSHKGSKTMTDNSSPREHMLVPVVEIDERGTPTEFRMKIDAQDDAVRFCTGMHPGLRVGGRVEVDELGSLVVSELSVSALGDAWIDPFGDRGGRVPLPAGGVTTTHLRSVSPKALLARVRETASDLPEEDDQAGRWTAALLRGDLHPVRGTPATGRARALASAPDTRRGRPPRSHDDLMRIAAIVLEAVEQGDGRTTKRVQEQESARLGREMPRETARSWIRACVRQGYLISPGAGSTSYLAGPTYSDNKEA